MSSTTGKMGPAGAGNRKDEIHQTSWGTTMKNVKLSRKQRAAAREGLNRFLSVLLSLAMVLQTSPVAYARMEDEGAAPAAVEQAVPEQEAAPAPESEPAPEPEPQVEVQEPVAPEAQQPAVTDTNDVVVETPEPSEQVTEPEQTVDIAVYAENATVTVNGQSLTNAQGTLATPEGQAVSFTVSPESGYRLADNSVKVVVDGQERELGTSGSYSLSAAEVKAGTQITVIAERIPTERVYTYKDENMVVTATLDEASAIPDEAQLRVNSITKEVSDQLDMYNYDAYMEALNKNAGEVDLYTAENTLLYDIAFMWYDEEAGKVVELQPEEGAVKLQFEFKKGQLTNYLGAEKASELEIKHLPLASRVRDNVDSTADATRFSAKDVIVEKPKTNTESVNLDQEKISFKLDDLSAVAISYTVDFVYDGYSLSIEGQGTITLSNLFEQLGINESVADVKSVVFSEPKYLTVEKQDNGDWLLTSLQPFSTKELLTVTMNNGDVYLIDVTDAQGAYTVTIKTQEHNAQGEMVDVADANFGSGYYLRVRVMRKPSNPSDEPTEVVGWNAVPFDWTSSSVDVSIDKFVPIDQAINQEYSQYTDLDPSQYVIETATLRVIKPSANYWVYSYNNANGEAVSDEPPAGYAFIAPTAIDDTHLQVNLVKSDPVNYNVRLQLDGVTDASSVDLSKDFNGAYVRVVVEHKNSGNTYAVVPITSGTVKTVDGKVVVDVPVPDTEWKDANSNGSVQEVFTGKEKKVTVDLVGGNPPTANSIGALVNEYVNSYMVESYPSSDEGTGTNRVTDSGMGESGPVTNMYDVVELRKGTDKFTDYSLENLLTKYNVITLCPNGEGNPGDGDFLNSNHTIGGILVRGDLIDDGMENIGSGTSATGSSVVGGSVPNWPGAIIGGGQRNTSNPTNPHDFYIGSVNSVVGDRCINGYDPGNDTFNTYGHTVVSDDYIDWDRLQNTIIDASDAMLNSATRVITENDIDGGKIFVEVGESVLLDIPDAKFNEGLTLVLCGPSNTVWGDAPGTIINCATTGDVKVPHLVVSTDGGATLINVQDLNTTGDKENADGMSLVWNYPKWLSTSGIVRLPELQTA